VRNNFACKYNFNKVRFGFHGLLDSFCLCENRGGNRDNSNRLFLLAGIDKIYKGVWTKVIIVMSISKGLFLFGSLLLTIALSFGYASLVYSLSSIQPFFVLLIAVILSRFFPSILKEEVSKSIVLVKIIAIISIFIGAFLIT